jgi:RNA polymerase sigma-70 factor (ECF subfamily)
MVAALREWDTIGPLPSGPILDRFKPCSLMLSTSKSLLERIQKRDDREAWQRWLAVYEPWLRSWLRRHQLQAVDVDDLVQNILTVVSQKLPTFIHNGQPGAFRTWLRLILVNQVRYFLRTRRQQARAELLPDWLAQLEAPASDLSKQWDQEHDQQLVHRLLATVQPEFEPRTWEVFQRLVLEARPAAEVAQHFHMERNAVYVAKARVLARLRQELRGLMDA